MKRDKLYTVGGNYKAKKLYPDGGLLAEAQAYKSANPWDFADDRDLISQYIQTDAYKQGRGGLFNMTRASNPFSRGNINGTMSGLATIGSPLITSAISGGYSTGGVGEGISTVGNAIGDALPEGPWKWGVKLGSTLVGGLVNRGWGVKENKQNIAAVKENIATARSAGNDLGNASTNEGVLNAAGNMTGSLGFSASDLYKNGWFTKKGTKKGNALNSQESAALAYQNNALMTGASNADYNMDSGVMRNFAAFGGPLDSMGFIEDMPATNYGFMKDYLTQREKQIDSKNKLSGISPTNAFCGGGHLFPYGGGTFTGAGATSRWGDEHTDSYPGVKDFNEAFDKAVAENQKTFWFQGREYNTQKENNPVREFNNRWVGALRSPNVKNPSKAYDRQAGPVGGPMSLIPMVTDTYNPELVSPTAPEMEYDPYVYQKYYSPLRSYPLTSSKAKPIMEKLNTRAEGGSLFALGGDVQSNGADFPTGLTHIDAGGSHEENKYQGVQVGVDQEGTPNLVEEGETIFNDYVFSNRIELDDEAKKAFHIGKKRDITYADMSKKLEKEASERPNDPISKAALKVQMQDLAEHQERQKQEMEAERAREAFEALSPEEQTAVMQQVAQQEQAAQEQAMQEEAMAQQQGTVAPEEASMMQEQGVPTADAMGTVAGGQPEVMEGQPVMAYGGKIKDTNLFPWGGYENLFNVTPPYAASNTAGFIPYARDIAEDEVLRREQEQNFIDWTNYVNNNWDSEYIQNYLKALDAAAGGNHLFDKDGKLLESAKDYFNNARTKNHKWGYYHLTPEQVAANRIFHAVEGDDDYLPEDQSKWVNVGNESRRVQLPNGDVVIYHNAGNSNPREFHRVEGHSDYLDGTPDTWNGVGKETRRETLPNGDVVIYHADANGADGTGNGNRKVVPNLRSEWPRYAGLFGPAVGLGMQALGIGRPDTKAFDGVIDAYDKTGASFADYKPIGNYITYSPLDIWAGQNRLNANARATDRAIMNSGVTQGSKVAGLLANEYNNQIGSGNLFRQAQEYNDNLRKQVAEFNRGTDQFNAQAYNQLAQFNASQRDRDRQMRAQLGMQAAAQKADMDAGWYNGIYGNVAGLFKGISDLGRENAERNMLARLAASGALGTIKPGSAVDAGLLKYADEAAEGGKIKRKKNKRRGLTI